MKLSELMITLPEAIAHGNLNAEVTGLTDDSRHVKPGVLFVAVKGTKSDGHLYLKQAAAAGASGLVIESGRAVAGRLADLNVPVIEAPNTRRFLGAVASRFYGNPASRLRMIGITGTNGKTTTTYVCKAILDSAGRRAGLIGTVSYLIGDKQIPASHTTPGALELQALLQKMSDGGLDTVIMEVSSHALALDRTSGCVFEAAVFTNLTQDHLDFHTDMEDYFQAKLRLFTGLEAKGRAIVNADDPYGARIAAGSAAPVWMYAIDRPADIRAEAVRITLGRRGFPGAHTCGAGGDSLRPCRAAQCVQHPGRDRRRSATGPIAPGHCARGSPGWSMCLGVLKGSRQGNPSPSSSIMRIPTMRCIGSYRPRRQ